MTNPYPTVISFYTPSWEYSKYAIKLKKNCRRLGLLHHIVEKPDTGNWLENTRIKPRFIYEALQELKRPVLWIDVDGSILRKPDLLKEYPYDFAARPKPKGHSRIWHVGTMFFNYTEPCLNFLRIWNERIDNGRGSDELNLDILWKQKKDELNLRTGELPPPYFEMLKRLEQPPAAGTIVAHRASKCPNKMEMKRRKQI